MSLSMARPVRRAPPAPSRRGGGSYDGPPDARAIALGALLAQLGRSAPSDRQMDILGGGGALVHYAGDLAVLLAPSVSIVGTREASEAGLLRAARLARELAAAGATVVSGLARGIDTAALTSAMAHQGRVAAVIGTPLDKAYPAENGALQKRIWCEHVLLSPFAAGEAVFRSNFPKRNRVMATVSDATVIVEASDTSGTLHQAAECQRLGRWLFIARSVADDRSLTWPAAFLGKPNTGILDNTEDVIAAIRR